MNRPAVIRVMKSKRDSVVRVIGLPKGFTYEYRKALIICPTEQVNPEIVANMLGYIDHEVLVHNHWVADGPTSSLQVWAGAVAEFNSKTHARIAAESLQRKSMLKVIFFKEFMDILMKAERMFPKEKKETTKIVIRAARSFEKENIGHLTSLLNEFGKPKKVTVYKNRTLDVISKVEYFSQFQAYAARTAMNGMLVDCIGFLKVEIEVSESGKEFDSFVKECFKKTMLGRMEHYSTFPEREIDHAYSVYNL